MDVERLKFEQDTHVVVNPCDAIVSQISFAQCGLLDASFAGNPPR